MLNIAVFVSGGGTNLQALIEKEKEHLLGDSKIKLVVASNSKAYAIKRAKENNIDYKVISKKEIKSITLFDQETLKILEEYNIGLVVLAGYLSMLGPETVDKYKNKIINIHPSLIPAFCGKGYYGIVPHEKVLEYGAKITGATVQFIDKTYDTGPIILQKAVEVLEDDTPESLQRRVMEEAEWVLLPKAVKLFADGKLKIQGRKVSINN